MEMLLHRGARVNATNMGDDIPLHLAAAHGHLEIVQMVSMRVLRLCLESDFTGYFSSSFATGRT